MGMFTEHLDEVGETYFTHMGKALGFAAAMAVAVAACLVHAVFPFLFVRSGSDRIERLHELMIVRRRALLDRGRPVEVGQRIDETGLAPQSPPT